MPGLALIHLGHPSVPGLKEESALRQALLRLREEREEDRESLKFPDFEPWVGTPLKYRFRRDLSHQANSPASGVHRAHPYTPVGAAMGSSSFEMLPSATDRAASDRGLSESMETVPILRSHSSPSIIQNPSQAMSPNLVAGSASHATPSGSGNGH